MNPPGHFDFYAVVLLIHIVAAISAFGVTFAYPVIDRVARRLDPRSLPMLHEAQIQVGRRVVTPGAIVVLIAGIYMASNDRWSAFGSGWWTGALVILLALVGMEHAMLIPSARRMRDQAAVDVRSAGHGAVTLSAEYKQLERQRRIFGGIASLLVVVAVFLMVVKPGA